MPGRNRLTARTITALCLAGTLVLPACISSFFTRSSTGNFVVLRIENATSSSARVLAEVLDLTGQPVAVGQPPQAVPIPVVTVEPGNVTYDVLEPIGASSVLAQQATGGTTDSSLFGPEVTVRVPGVRVTQGIVACGPVIRLSAVIDGTDSTVVFSGDGSGTVAFDQGSQGETGERYLLEGLDFTCGDQIVLRVDDDGASGSISSEGTPMGQVAVVAFGSGSPFGPIDSGGGSGGGSGSDGGSDGGSGEPGPTTFTLRVDNNTSTLADVNLAIATAAASSETFDVSVPSQVTTQGQFVCGQQLTISARFVNTTAGAAEEDAVVILTGDGSGASGFDGSSVSKTGERILVLGTHYECGETVRVAINDDSTVNTPNGFNAAGTGAGEIAVFPIGQDPDDGGGDPGDPSMNVVVENLTVEFVRVSVAAGTGGLGPQLDIFVPPSGVSTGQAACSDRFTITAYSEAQEALAGLQNQILIILSGDGTGTAGFDGGSVGSIGQRLLLRDVHYDCGQTFRVRITDPGRLGFTEPSILDADGAVIGFEDVNSNGVQDEIPDRLGSGTVGVE